MLKDRYELASVTLLIIATVFFILKRTILFDISETVLTLVEVIIFFGFTVIHGKKTIGIWNTLIFLVITYSLTLMLEYIGALGLIPGCKWHYTTNLGPMFMDKVPYIIPLTWFTYIYCVYSMTNVIFGKISEDRSEFERIGSVKKFIKLYLVSMVAGAIMMSWDLINDPVMVARGNWYWPEGGLYYGIPLMNYFGWFSTSALIYLIFSIYMSLVKRGQIYFKTIENKRSVATIYVIVPYLLALIFQGIDSFIYGVQYALPWAGVTMSIAIVITIWRFIKIRNKQIE
ncbi:MAG: carotenoid biosynthesis protein [Candidatus Helarchaeota archaeon]